MERRQFLITLAAGGLTLVAGKKAFAQTEELDSFYPESIRAQDIQVTIKRNHGHELILRDSDLRDGRSHSYDIQGRATHPHTVYLSRNDFMTMNRGGTVQVTSSFNDGHSHVVVLSVRRPTTGDIMDYPTEW